MNRPEPIDESAEPINGSAQPIDESAEPIDGSTPTPVNSGMADGRIGLTHRSVRRIYSQRSASIGSSAAAFQAGYQPKPVPMREQTIRPARAQPQGKTMAMSSQRAMPLPPKTPRMMPARPPSSERTIASS